MNEKLEGDIKETNSKLLDLNDQTDSLDGRLNRASPFSQFGKDNIIHGPQWLVEQPSNKLAIQLSMVNDKKSLYEIAQRYSYHLTQQMAYYKVKTALGEWYVLTYGSFAVIDVVSAALFRMPHYINQQRPYVARMADIQRLISL
jgi:septal ring-binding cell division protein DamX